MVVVVVVVVVVEVVVVVVEDVGGRGNVMINAPLPVESSVSEPVLAPGVALLAPERLATQRLSRSTANAERREK